MKSKKTSTESNNKQGSVDVSSASKNPQTVHIRVKAPLEIGTGLVAPGHEQSIPMEVEKAKALEAAGKLTIVG